MKKNLLLVFFVSLCLACNSQSQKSDTKTSGLSLNITGKLNNAVAGKVYLEKMNERNIATKIDSSATTSNAFIFKTTIPEPGIYQLNVADQQIIGLILDGGENLTVTADGVATPEKAATSKVEGSKTMDKFNEVMTQMQQFGQTRSVLEGKFQAAKTEKDREAIRKEYQAAELAKGQAVLPKIKELGTSMAGIIAANNFLNPETDGQYMMELAQKLKDEGKNHFYANIFIQEVNRKSIGTIGTPAPDFELVDLNGKKVKLSDQKGKTPILDFNNQTAITYGVEGIPAKFCIDKDGKFKHKSAGYLGSSQAVYDEMVKWVEEGE